MIIPKQKTYVQIKKLPKKFKENNKSKKMHLSDRKKLTKWGYIGLTLKYLLLVGLVFVILYPIVYLIVSSFNGSLSRNSLSSEKSFAFTFQHFIDLFQVENWWNWMFNSIIIGFVTMIIVVIFSGLMAYGFSRYVFAGKKSWLIFLILVGLIPNLMALIIFYIMSDILNENLQLPRIIVLLLLYSGGGIVSNLYILKAYIDGISSELDDAGKIDGLSNWKLFTRIIAPLAKPMLSIVAFWSFIAPFGDIILSNLILQSKEEWTVPLGLRSFITNNRPQLINYPLYATGSLVIAIPVVAVFMILQRNLSSGATAGAVKG